MQEHSVDEQIALSSITEHCLLRCRITTTGVSELLRVCWLLVVHSKEATQADRRTRYE